MKSANILLVDDDRNFLRVLSYQVEEAGLRVHPVPSAAEALERVSEGGIDLAVTDLRMPGMDGIALTRAIKRLNADLPVIVLTAHGTIDKAVEAIKAGATDFLSKPFEKEEIWLAIEKALKMVDLVQQNRRLSQAVEREFRFEGIVGSSKKFREVLELARQLSGVDTTALIQGPSGTGKELLARAIHFNSRRKNKPFVVVNCGAIPKDLMESELFGYKKGAFTGAVSSKKGKFEVADGGTLFLDEVGELPAAMQVKLLRVLQQKEVDVVGDPHPRAVDVRIIAATNQDLKKLTEEGGFREDLYYRLAVAPLFIPPLKERREDIPLLAHSLLKQFTQSIGKDVQLSTGALEALQRYSWPGNVRELENILERLVVFNRSGEVGLEDLPGEVCQPVRTVDQFAVEIPEEPFSLEELEKSVLKAALDKHGGNQSQAARHLGLTRNTLIYRMQKFGLKS